MFLKLQRNLMLRSWYIERPLITTENLDIHVQLEKQDERSRYRRYPRYKYLFLAKNLEITEIDMFLNFPAFHLSSQQDMFIQEHLHLTNLLPNKIFSQYGYNFPSYLSDEPKHLLDTRSNRKPVKIYLDLKTPFLTTSFEEYYEIDDSAFDFRRWY